MGKFKSCYIFPPNSKRHTVPCLFMLLSLFSFCLKFYPWLSITPLPALWSPVPVRWWSINEQIWNLATSLRGQRTEGEETPGCLQRGGWSCHARQNNQQETVVNITDALLISACASLESGENLIKAKLLCNHETQRDDLLCSISAGDLARALTVIISVILWLSGSSESL